VPARLTAALFAALLTLALGASPASAAKTRTIKATIVGNPYVISDVTSGLPVLISRKSAKVARLKSPLGVLRVPRLRAVPTPDGTRLPANLRVGDRLRTRVKVTRAVRRAVYAQMRGKRLSVYKRSPELSVRELEVLLVRTRAELAALSARMDEFESWVSGRFGQVDAALGALGGRLDLLEADLAALRSDLQAQIDALAGELDGVGADLQGLLARVTAAEAAIDGLLEQVGEIESALDDLATDVTSLCGVPLIPLGTCG
jgi:BMFP domain-containing protein YqiC